MDYVPDVLGAFLIIVSVIVAVETKKVWLKRVWWTFFVLLVIAQAVFQIRSRRIEQQRASVNQTEYRTDRNNMMGLLQGGQKLLNLIVGELQDIRNDARTKQSSPKPEQPGFGEGGYGGNGYGGNVEKRAATAQQAAEQLAEMYARQIKLNSWPLGSTGANHPQAQFTFQRFFPEAIDVNGVDRFFLYYLMKNDNFDPATDTQKLIGMYDQEFGGNEGSSLLSGAEDKLKRLGFTEELSAQHVIRLREPYRSRFLRKTTP